MKYVYLFLSVAFNVASYLLYGAPRAEPVVFCEGG